MTVITYSVCKKNTTGQKLTENGLKCDIHHLSGIALCYEYVINITKYFDQELSTCDHPQILFCASVKDVTQQQFFKLRQ